LRNVYLADLVLKFRERTSMRDAPLLIEGGNWLSARNLAPAGCHFLVRHLWVDGADDMLHHCAPKVPLSHYAVCLVLLRGLRPLPVISSNSSTPPAVRGKFACLVSKDIAPSINAQSSHDNANVIP